MRNQKHDLNLFVKDGYHLVVADLLEQEFYQNKLLEKNASGATPVHIAARWGRINVMAELLKYSKGREALVVVDECKRTPLMICKQYNFAFVVDDILGIKYDGKTLLQLCFDDKDKEAIKEIVKYPIGCMQLNTVDNESFRSVFQLGVDGDEVMRNRVLSAVKSHVASYGVEQWALSSVSEVLGRILSPVKTIVWDRNQTKFQSSFDNVLEQFRREINSKPLIVDPRTL